MSKSIPQNKIVKYANITLMLLVVIVMIAWVVYDLLPTLTYINDVNIALMLFFLLMSLVPTIAKAAFAKVKGKVNHE